MRKWKHREVKELAQSHTTYRKQAWIQMDSSLIPKPVLFVTKSEPPRRKSLNEYIFTKNLFIKRHAQHYLLKSEDKAFPFFSRNK